MVLDPGDRSRHSPQPAVPDRHLRQPAELFALQQPIVKLPQDEGREHRDIPWRIEESHESEEPVEQWSVHRTHMQCSPVVIVPRRLPPGFDDQCGEITGIHGERHAEIRLLRSRFDHPPERGQLQRHREVLRWVVDVRLVADRHLLATLHHHVDRRLLQHMCRFGRVRKPVQLQLLYRRLVPAIADRSAIEQFHQLIAQSVRTTCLGRFRRRIGAARIASRALGRSTAGHVRTISH